MKPVSSCLDAQALGCLYTALATGFAVPRLPMSEIGENMSRAVSDGKHDLTSRVTGLAQAMGRSPEQRVEYARLFYGPYSVPVPLYEGLYRDGTIMGSAATRVRQIYRQAGLDMGNTGELPDHLAVELEFCAAMSHLESQEVAGSGQLRRDFIRDHLTVWLPEVISRLEDVATGSLYLDLARATREALVLDLSAVQ